MIYLFFSLISILLLVGFGILTRYEARRGRRVFATHRAAFDAWIARIVFVVTHVDFNAFVHDETRRLTRKIGHVGAEALLQGVRTLERLLTQSVRRLRSHQREGRHINREETREFVKTLSIFKGRLKETMPEIVPVREQR